LCPIRSDAEPGVLGGRPGRCAPREFNIPYSPPLCYF
jgi:hypothetical protein